MATAALIAALLLIAVLVLAIRHRNNRDKIVCRKADQMVRDHIAH
jgi:hypothetical protein